MKTIILAVLFICLTLELHAKIIYLEPVQNAKYVSIHNNIIIGFDKKIENRNLNSILKVTGTISGTHDGEIILTADKKKFIFKPNKPFAYNETVEVIIHNLKTYSFQTQIKKIENDRISNALDEYDYSAANDFLNSGNFSVLPQLTVTISNNPSAGPIFINNFQTPNYAPHIIIANNDGTPFYYREFVGNAPEFKRQPNGLITYFSFSKGKYYAEDSDFNIVDSFYCGNGYSTDNHELKILNSGNALLMSYDRQPVDMSLLVPGGNPNATVIGLIIQEIDVNKNVVFQWRSWDHYEILDAYHVNFTLATVDAVHGNSIELDNDGTLLISARHLNEVTKISRQTGEMVWRMGGVNNEFTFLNDTIPFIYQHDVRRIANGNITLYDNGNFRTPVLFSRAVEYQVDEVNKTVNLIWQYRNNPDIHGPNRGSVQRLKNGNTLIGWGGTNPTLSEVTPAGNVVLEMSLPQSVYSYRAFRDEATFTLNVKLAIEGFYNSQSNTLNMKDTVRAYIRSSNTPYNIIDSAKSIVDSVNMTGNFQYYNISAGTYYISTKHRNGLETWSKAGGESFTSGGVYLYDFTVSDLSAFGNNLMLKGSKYCIYSGDINQDENIDLTDVITIANDAASFVTGYVNTDVNGDNISDLTDVLITFNNSSGFVSVIRP